MDIRNPHARGGCILPNQLSTNILDAFLRKESAERTGRTPPGAQHPLGPGQAGVSAAQFAAWEVFSLHTENPNFKELVDCIFLHLVEAYTRFGEESGVAAARLATADLKAIEDNVEATIDPEEELEPETALEKFLCALIDRYLGVESWWPKPRSSGAESGVIIMQRRRPYKSAKLSNPKPQCTPKTSNRPTPKVPKGPRRVNGEAGLRGQIVAAAARLKMQVSTPTSTTPTPAGS